ncbi:UvrD-helicase domain-containing protein [Kribbella solani]|uniref:DNA helicase-2/ATP-dependent DNA helicase PcrA n=1 Tax=Kribbella solani TaxID=236067 RepID=A0A841DSW3_9ACTN|nr:UvrD-helicase domain-containing protein [Kribbella solani]MBB5979846.1 DNA helicase-2/ATP-dependent DNA helicase PcrA [Kribbella solani]
MTQTAGTSLTVEQRLAAGVLESRLFIEAGPGTGKTTVAAQRFGVHRFDPRARTDTRAVVAVSFTRAATLTLARRVKRFWGSRALTWPHRIVTLDTIMSDLVGDLLHAGLLRWPNGHKDLQVEDSWASFSGTTRNRTAYRLTIEHGQVVIRRYFTQSHHYTVPATVSLPLLDQGICTHDDVRDVLKQAIADPTVAAHVRARLATSTRALIVDEVFDANDLDIAIIEFAVEAGIAVTLVGDPWQALYVFRGARPDVVPLLLDRHEFRRLALTESFRWREPSQRQLAEDLRAGRGVTLPISDDTSAVDVVLALQWKPMWELGPEVLPLAFHGFKGGQEEAAATLLLNHATRNIFSLDATYLNDSLTALAISDRDLPRRIEPALQAIIETLRPGTRASIRAAYVQLSELVAAISPRRLRKPHASHTGRLALIQERLGFAGRPVPGLTTHQAKGREWDTVGIRLSPDEQRRLANGLSVERDTDRQLYVACTRACLRTAEISP